MSERGRVGLGDLVPGRAVSGIVTCGEVTVVAVRMFGPTAAQVTYRRPDGTVEERILYEEDAERLAEVAPGTAGGGFDADPGLFRLAAEALRIRMAARGGRDGPARLRPTRSVSAGSAPRPLRPASA